MAAADEDDWGEDDVAESGAAAPAAVLDIGLSDDGEGLVAVSVLLPESENYERRPNDICCLIDVSGSMGAEATYEADGVEVTSNRFSMLDIVKHAVKTVVHMLKDGDRLALVTFSDDAKTVCALTAMTSEGKEAAITALEALRPEGATNLWAGMNTAMEALRETPGSKVASAKTLLVLTDGLPNEEPEGGTVAALKNYQESHPDFTFQINTFGFGSAVDSDLLLQMAVQGSGTYAFIPDALIVGTVFVNCIANVLSTYTQTSTLHLMAKGGAQVTGLPVGFPSNATTDASWGRVVDFGALQIGQSRQLVLPMTLSAHDESFLEVVLTYPSPSGKECKVSFASVGRLTSPSASVASKRARVANAGTVAIDAMNSGQEEIARQAMETVCSLIKTAGSFDEQLRGLGTDAEGRMSKAISTTERFHRWGKHYLRALVRAHQLQLCTNFMDPGLQSYGSAMFKSVREEGDKIFLSLPPPKAALDEAGIPCDICRREIPFSQYAEHIEACANPKRAARPKVAPSRPTPAADEPEMAAYYAGSGGG